MLKCLRYLLVWSGCVWVGVPVFGQPEQTDVFSVGELGYKEHRIPSLVVTNQGTLLAFSESGITDSDYGNRDIRLRRSDDGGRSWSRDALTILDAGTSRTGSPCGFVDRKSGRVHFITAIDSRRVMHFQSNDDGRTWSDPRDITYAFDQFHERFKWTGCRCPQDAFLAGFAPKVGNGPARVVHSRKGSMVRTMYSAVWS